MDWCGEWSGLTTWSDGGAKSISVVIVVDEEVGICGRLGGMEDKLVVD